MRMEIARAREHLIRGLKLKCPACGLGQLYESFFKMRDECPYCGLVFAREQGYFIGAIYLNVVVTESLIFATYLALILAHRITEQSTYTILFILALLVPVLFHRHARSLWLGLDHLLDPPAPSARDTGYGESD
jgi:uncharacterized protein (DUF983 family)